MKIIGLGHYSRTGKDTIANYIVDIIREMDPTLRVAKIPFATKLKQIAHELYSWDGLQDQAYYDTKEGEKFRDVPLPTIGLTPVEIWVALGTPGVRQAVYDKTWIDYLLKTDHKLDVLIIPDVRFPNECDAIKEAGGILAKIVRPGYGPRKTVADRQLVGWDGWDFIFGGTGRLFELRQRAAQLARWATGGPFPTQTAEGRAFAKSVEVIEPWEKPHHALPLKVMVDETVGLKICRAASVCAREGFPLLEGLRDAVTTHFPQLAGRNHFREMFDE